jgi:hypothetical protein
MKLLLKLVPVLLIILLSIDACKKDSKQSVQNYMRFKLDGMQVECDGKFFAISKTTAGPDANISFNAGWGDNALDFQIFTYGTTDITPGQYMFGPGKAYSAQLWPNGTLTTPGIHYSYIAGATVPSAAIAGSGQITIIEINAEYIKGSFDFITAVNSSTGLFKTVTNGEFLIKRG